MSDSNNDDFLFLGEEEEAPSSLSIELKKSDNIKKEKVENNAILINKNDKVNFNDFVNSDILSKLTKKQFEENPAPTEKGLIQQKNAIDKLEKELVTAEKLEFKGKEEPVRHAAAEQMFKNEGIIKQLIVELKKN